MFGMGGSEFGMGGFEIFDLVLQSSDRLGAGSCRWTRFALRRLVCPFAIKNTT